MYSSEPGVSEALLHGQLLVQRQRQGWELFVGSQDPSTSCEIPTELQQHTTRISAFLEDHDVGASHLISDSSWNAKGWQGAMGEGQG